MTIFCYPVSFPVISLIWWTIGALSLSSRSIHISTFWISFLKLSRKVTCGLILVKNPIECSLCVLIFLKDLGKHCLWPGYQRYWKVVACCRIWFHQGELRFQFMRYVNSRCFWIFMEVFELGGVFQCWGWELICGVNDFILECNQFESWVD